MIEEPDHSSNQSSTDETSTSQGKASTGGNQNLNVEELVNQALERKQTLQNVNQLRNQLHWLTGFFVIAVIALGGGLGWVAYRLQAQQQQITEQNVQNPQERIQQLEDQIETLQQQVPDPETIENLETQLDEVTAAIDKNQQTLERVLKGTQTQDLQSDQLDPTPSESPSIPSDETDTFN